MKTAAGKSELDQLAHLAAGADAGIITPGNADAPGLIEGAPGPAADPAVEWAELPTAVGAMLSFLAPELRQVYTVEACQAWGRAMVPIADKYGWKPSGAFPWLSLVGATAGLLVPTVQVLKAKAAVIAEAAPGGSEKDSNNVVAMRPASVDPDLADPTQANRPPRPV